MSEGNIQSNDLPKQVNFQYDNHNLKQVFIYYFLFTF